MQLKLKFALLSFSNVLDENNISGGKKKNPKSWIEEYLLGLVIRWKLICLTNTSAHKQFMRSILIRPQLIFPDCC